MNNYYDGYENKTSKQIEDISKIMKNGLAEDDIDSQLQMKDSQIQHLKDRLRISQDTIRSLRNQIKSLKTKNIE